jgi:hypothetical protein
VPEHAQHAVDLELALAAVRDQLDGLPQGPPPRDVGSLGEGVTQLRRGHQPSPGCVDGERSALRDRHERPGIDDGSRQGGDPEACTFGALRGPGIEAQPAMHHQVTRSGPLETLVDGQVQRTTQR